MLWLVFGIRESENDEIHKDEHLKAAAPHHTDQPYIVDLLLFAQEHSFGTDSYNSIIVQTLTL